MQSGHKRSAEGDDVSEAGPGARPAQETPVVDSSYSSDEDKAEAIIRRRLAVTAQFENGTMTEEAYTAAISEMRTEFVRDAIVFDARVFNRSLDTIVRKTTVYGEDGVRKLKCKAFHADCECAFHVLTERQRREFFDCSMHDEEEDLVCGSSKAIPSPTKLRRVKFAFGSTGEKRERVVSSTLSDKCLKDAVLRASEKVLGRPDGYAIAITECDSHSSFEGTEKLDTGEQAYTLFERIMGQQVHDARTSYYSNYY